MRARRSSGFTLLELLVSLAIITVLLGISLGVLARFGRKDELEATTNAVRALLRRARNASQEERYGTVVELDPQASEVRAQLRTTVTRFRFEDAGGPAPATPTPGGDPTAAPGTTPAAPVGPASTPDEDDDEGGDPAKVPVFDVQGALSFSMSVQGGEPDQGRYGQGLLFERRGAWGQVADRPALSPAEGIWVEAWIYPGRLEDRLTRRPRATTEAELARAEPAGAPPRPAPARSDEWRRRAADDPPRFGIARKGRAWSVALCADYSIEACLTGPDEGGVEVTYVARTAPDTIRPLRWWRVALGFDGRRALLYVDGIPRVLVPGQRQDVLPKRLLRDPVPLSLSDPLPDACFYGIIDELHVAAILDAQTVPIPPNMALVAVEDAVAFDILGQLDTGRHAEPVVIYLSDDERAQGLVPATPASTATKSRAEVAAEKARMATGHPLFEQFSKACTDGRLDPGRVRAIVVERTGLVR